MTHPLEKFKPIAQAIADLFGSHVEVVIHDIAKDQIFAIVNNCSGNEVGMASNLGLANDTEVLVDDVLGPYEKLGAKGQRISSITSVLREEDGTAIGLLCVNVDFSKFQGAYKILEELIAPTRVERKPEVLFRNDWQDIIYEEVQAFVTEQGVSREALNPEQRRNLLKAIDDKGLLYARRSVDQLSSILKMSRSTLYKDLARIRENDPVKKALL